MTTINATINGESGFGAAAKRIDVWHEGGGIGRWEIMLDNSSGASQILSTNMVASDLGINGVTLMKGYVDDVLPEVSDETAVFSKYVKAIGRNYGRDLASLFLIKQYVDWKFDDLVEDALGEVDSEITFSSPSTAPIGDVDFNKSFLQTGFVEGATLTGYDFIVNNSKALQLWSLDAAPSSGVLLKSIVGAADNNILLIDPETKAGVDIRNYVRVDAGTLKDHWTEGNAEDLTGLAVYCTLENEYTDGLVVNGAASIKATITSNDHDPEIHFTCPLYNHDEFDFSKVGSETASIWVMHDTQSWPSGGALNKSVWICMEDSNGSTIHYAPTKNTWTDTFTKHEFPVGVDLEIDSGSGYVQNKWQYMSGSSFNWHVVDIWVVVIRYLDSDSGHHLWVDGLKLPVDVWAVAEDATSQAAYPTGYGKRMIPLNRTDVKSQLRLQGIADTELENRKDPVYKLNLTCTLQTGLLYAGYLVDVLAPTAYICYESTPETYRILSVHHAAEPGVDLCRGHDAITELELIKHSGGVGADSTRFKLASSPAVAISIRHENRLRVLESSLTGSGSMVGGGGGGGGYTGFGLLDVRCEAVALTNFEMIAQTYGYLGEVWQPNLDPRTDDVAQFENGSSFIRFSDSESNNFLNLFLVISSENSDNPILALNHGLLVKKDVQAGGFLGCSQGAVLLGHGLDVADDPPKITLAHANTWLTEIPVQSSPPASPDEGDYYIDSDYDPDRLFQYVGGEWKSLGSVQNYSGGYDTLYITKNTAVPKAYGVDYAASDLGNVRCNTLFAELMVFPSITFDDGSHTCVAGINNVGGGHYMVEVDSQDDSVEGWQFDLPVTFGFGISVTGTIGASLAITTDTQFKSNLAVGTKPIDVTSTTLCTNLNADLLDGHHWADVPAAWNGGTVTNDITIQKANSLLKLYNTNVANNATLQFYDGTNTANIYLKTNSNELRIDHALIVEQTLSCNVLQMDNFSITQAGIVNLKKLTIDSSYGTSGQVLTSQGSGNAPIWSTLSGWNGGTVTNDITINKTSAMLKLDATAGKLVYSSDITLIRDSGNLRVQTASDKSTIVEQTLYCKALQMDNTTISQAGVIVTTTGIQIGSGYIYWQTATTPDVLESDQPWIFGSTVNALSVSTTSDVGVGGTLTVTGSTSLLSYLVMHGNITPITGNSYDCGNATYYWANVYANTFHGKNTTIQSFDSMDDLTLLKASKNITTTKNSKIIDIIDLDTLPFLKSDESAEFYDQGKMHGFVFGCVKALAKKQDENEQRFNALLDEVEALKAEIAKLKGAAA